MRSLLISAFILAVPVALITTNIRAAVSEQAVYDYSVRNYGAAEASGIPESELLRANAELRHYLTDRDPGPLAIRVRDNGGEIVPLFNARETAHMSDVRDLVRAVFRIQVLAVALVLTLAVVMLALWPPRALAAASLYGALLTAGIIGVAGFLAVTGFDAAWTRFHTLFFSNDLWRLDPSSDHLIQMFPEPFWQRITVILGGATLGEALMIAAASGAYLYLSRPRMAEAMAPVLEPGAAGESLAARPGRAERRRFVH